MGGVYRGGFCLLDGAGALSGSGVWIVGYKSTKMRRKFRYILPILFLIHIVYNKNADKNICSREACFSKWANTLI